MASIPTNETLVRIYTRDVTLEGSLNFSANVRGVVVFAHGSGSGRFSPRNRYVAQVLQRAGLGTLLMDLLTRGEEEIDAQTHHLRFDIELLAQRLIGVVDWLEKNPATERAHIGCFGASTGAAAALIAAAERPAQIAAVVSRGGRPDLAGAVLPRVQAPTLLLVGGNDKVVLQWNRDALQLLRAEKQLEIISGATHLFEEEGALERVAELAAQWFVKYLDVPRA